MRKTLWLMLVIVIAVGLAFSVSGCGKKKMTAEEEMGPAVEAEERAPQPGEPGYEKIYEESMAAKEESLDAQAAMKKDENEFLEGRTSAPLLPIYFDFTSQISEKISVPELRKMLPISKKIQLPKYVLKVTVMKGEPVSTTWPWESAEPSVPKNIS